MKNKNNVYILSDVHGDYRCIKRWLDDFAQAGDTMLSVGDFGSGFIHDKKFEALGRRFQDKDCKLLVTRGNHSDPDYHKENRTFHNLEFLPDYTVRQIEGENFLFMGGAVSIDRINRVEDFDWWRDEGFVLDKRKLDSYKNIDRVITHNCPLFACPMPCGSGANLDYYEKLGDKSIKRACIKECENIQRAYEILAQNNTIKTWHFGHYHLPYRTEKDGTLFRCLDIAEIVCL